MLIRIIKKQHFSKTQRAMQAIESSKNSSYTYFETFDKSMIGSTLTMFMGITTEQPLLALNHVSYVCRSLSESVDFYQNVLGFVLVKRPSSFDFEGAWLYNYGMGIHLVQSKDVPRKPSFINPKDNHISFQCADIEKVKAELKKTKVEYLTATVEDGGIKVDQLFFHDPDGNMIEICNCQNLPVLPLTVPPVENTSSISS